MSPTEIISLKFYIKKTWICRKNLKIKMCDDEYEGKKIVLYSLYKSKLKNRIREEIIGWVIAWKHWNTFRRSQQDLFCKKDISKNFTKFIEKDMCQSLLNKVRSLSLQIYLKMVKMFCCEFCEIVKNTFFTERL